MSVQKNSFLKSDTKLRASDPPRFRKFFFFLIKIAVTDQIKILDRKIKQNETQYDLDRNAAKIFALPSGKLDRDECLTGEDLNYKPSTTEIVKFDYYPLSEYFNKGLKEEDKQDGLLNTVQNIEDKSEEQLKIIGNKNVNSNDEPFHLGKAYNEIEEIDKKVDYKAIMAMSFQFF